MKLYYVTVRFDNLDENEHYVYANSAQDAVNKIRGLGLETPHDIVRVALSVTDWQ